MPLAVSVVMLVIRPLNVFLSTWGSSLNLKEKAFLSWIAPRGIVAASMASVFAFAMQESGVGDGQFLESFTYSVIAATVIIQGCTAGMVGRFLDVLRPGSRRMDHRRQPCARSTDCAVLREA